MKLERIELKQLTGINRNKVRGTENIQPFLLYNLAFDKDGGYTPMGVPASAGSLPGTLFGYDDLGYVTLIDTARYRIYDGVNASQLQSAASYANPSKGVHIPGVGAYANMSQFCVFDSDGVKVEPFSYNVTSSSETLPPPELIATYANLRTLDQDRASGRILAAGFSGLVMESNDDGETWTTVTTSGLGSTNIHLMRRNNTAWIAVSTAGGIWRSEDGAAWAQEAADGTIMDVAKSDIAHDDDQTWIVSQGSGPNGSRSADDGLTWAGVGLVDHDATGVDFNENTNIWYAMEYGETSANSNTDNRKSADSVVFNAQGFVGDYRWFRVASATDGQYIAIGRTLDTIGNVVGYSKDSGDNWTIYGVTSRVGISGFIDRVVEWEGLFFAFGANEYATRDVAAWRRVPYSGVQIFDAVVANSGNVISISYSGEVYKHNTSDDMPAGQYQLYALTYVNTRAGKLVTHVYEDTFTFTRDFGNSISVVTPANPTTSDEVYTEVYLKFAKRAEDADGLIQQVDLDTRDAILFKIMGPGETEVISEPPELNRILPSQGNIVIMAYRTYAAVNGSRVWAIPSTSLSDYTFLGEDTEIERFFESNILSYSELGYVNLGTQDSQEKIDLLASGAISSITSTPSGLMVFGTNEAFIISGDYASDDLAIARFPDIIGCDAGVRPALFGGIVFVIWNGEAYAIVGAQAQKVAREAWLRERPFVQVVADLERKDVILRSSSETEKLWRLDIDSGQVFNNVIQNADYVIPNRAGARYVTAGAVSEVVQSGSFPTPIIDYRDIDYGDNRRLDQNRRVRLRVDNWNIGATLPRLYFQITPSHPDIATESGSHFVEAEQREEELIFTLPLGLHSRKVSYRLKLLGMPSGASIEPNILFEFIPGKML